MGEWRPIEEARLGGDALFWNPLWRYPLPGKYVGDRKVAATGLSGGTIPAARDAGRLP